MGPLWLRLFAIVWSIARVASFTEVFSITKDALENSYYVGNQESNFFIGKRDPSCGFEWTSTDGSTSGDDDRDQNDEILYSVIVADDGFLYATGSTRGNFSSPSDEAPNLDAAVVVYDPTDGSAVRQRQYDIVSSFDNVGSAIVQKQDGLLLVSVYGSLPNVQNSAIFETRLLEIDKDTLETQSVYTLTVTTTEFFRVTGGPKILDFIYDFDSNSIVAVGHILGRGILWRFSLDSSSVTSQAEWGTAFGSYQISGFTTDGAGAFYVVGSSLENVLGNTDLSSPVSSEFHAYVIRYDGLTDTTTTETWVRQLDAPGSSQSGGDITIDPVTGEIVVIGTFDADFEVIDSQTSQAFQVSSVTNDGLTDVFVWVLEPQTGNFSDIRISEVASTPSEDRGNVVQVLSDRRVDIGGVINDGTDQNPLACDESEVASPSPTASFTPSLSPTPTPSQTPSITPTPSRTPSTSPTPSQTLSATPTPSQTLSATPTPSQTLSATPTSTQTFSITPTVSQTFSTPPTSSQTFSITPTPSRFPASSPTQSQSPTQSGIPTVRPSISSRVSATPSLSVSPSATHGPSLIVRSSQSLEFTPSASPVSIIQTSDTTASAISSTTPTLSEDVFEVSPVPSLFEPSEFESALPLPSSLMSPSSSSQARDISGSPFPASPSPVSSSGGLSNVPQTSLQLISPEASASISFQPTATGATSLSPFPTPVSSDGSSVSMLPSPSFAQIPSVTPSRTAGIIESVAASFTPRSTFILAPSESVIPIPSNLFASVFVSPDASFVITTPFAVGPGNELTSVTPEYPNPTDDAFRGQVLPSFSSSETVPQISMAMVLVTIFPSDEIAGMFPEESMLPALAIIPSPGEFLVAPSSMVFPEVSVQSSYLGILSPTFALDASNELELMASSSFEDLDFSPVLPLLPSVEEASLLPSQLFNFLEDSPRSSVAFPSAEESFKVEDSGEAPESSPGSTLDMSVGPLPSALPELEGSGPLDASPEDLMRSTFSPSVSENPSISEFRGEEVAPSSGFVESSLGPPGLQAPSPSGLPSVQVLPSFGSADDPFPSESQEPMGGRNPTDISTPSAAFEEGDILSDTGSPLPDDGRPPQFSIAESPAPSVDPLEDGFSLPSESISVQSSPFFLNSPSFSGIQESVQPPLPVQSSAIFPSSSTLPVLSPSSSEIPSTEFSPEVSSEEFSMGPARPSESLSTSKLPESPTLNESDEPTILPSETVPRAESSPEFAQSDAPHASLVLSPTVLPTIIDVSPFLDVSFAPISIPTSDPSPENSVFLFLQSLEPSGIVFEMITPEVSARPAHTFESTTDPQEDGTLNPSPLLFQSPEPSGVVYEMISPEVSARPTHSFESTTDPEEDGALIPSPEFSPSSQPPPQATRGVDSSPTVTVVITARPTVTVVISTRPTVTVTPAVFTPSASLSPSESGSADPSLPFVISISPSAFGPEPVESIAPTSVPSPSVTSSSGPFAPTTLPSPSVTSSLESIASTSLPSPSATLPLESSVLTSFPSPSATLPSEPITSTPVPCPSATPSLDSFVSPSLPSPLVTSSLESIASTSSPSPSATLPLESIASTSLPLPSATLPLESFASTSLPSPSTASSSQPVASTSPSTTSNKASASASVSRPSPSSTAIGPSLLLPVFPIPSSSPALEEEEETLDGDLILPTTSSSFISPTISQSVRPSISESRSPPPLEGSGSPIGPTLPPEESSPTPSTTGEATFIPSPTKTPTPLPLLFATETPVAPESSQVAPIPELTESPVTTPSVASSPTSPSPTAFGFSPSAFPSLTPSSSLSGASLGPIVSQSQTPSGSQSSLPSGSALPSTTQRPSLSSPPVIPSDTVEPSASSSALPQSPAQTTSAEPTNEAVSSPFSSASPVATPTSSSGSRELFPSISSFATPSSTRTPVPSRSQSVDPVPNPTTTPSPGSSNSIFPSPRTSTLGTEEPDADVRETPTTDVRETPVVDVRQTPTVEVRETPIVDVSETPIVDVSETPVPSDPDPSGTPEETQSPSPTTTSTSSSSPTVAIGPSTSVIASSPGQTSSPSPSPTNIPDFSCNKPDFVIDSSQLLETNNFQRVEMVIQVAGPNLTNACGLNFLITERFVNLSAVNTQSTAALWFVTLIEDGPAVFSSSSTLVTIEVVNNVPTAGDTVTITPSPSPSVAVGNRELFAGSVLFHVTAYLNALSVDLAQGSYVEYIDSQNIVRRMKEEGYKDIEWTGMITAPRVIDVRRSEVDIAEPGGISAGAIGAVSAVSAMIVGVAMLIFKDGIAMAVVGNSASGPDPPVAEMV